MTTPRPVVLCILDGWGLRADSTANAPVLANTPVFDGLMATCPSGTLITHGPDVGLPEGQMGNSEVGHMNIGAGRVVSMDIGRIDLAIERGEFHTRPAFGAFTARLRETGGTAHLFGLVSNGGVHSQHLHMAEAIARLTEAGIPVRVHAITDGRDVPPQSAGRFISDLQARLGDDLHIATVIGRYYAMDRDNRWDRVARAYRAIAHGGGEGTLHLPGADPMAAISGAYDRGETDEFIQPTVLGDHAGMAEGDGLFCLNFRADRAREILAAIARPDFDGFDPEPRPALAARLGMVEYSDDHNAWYDTLFPKQRIDNTLTQWVAARGLTQFHIAETEKYPHVTFFLNGGKEEPVPGEDRYMAASPKVATYDLQPDMSAPEVAEHLVAAIRQPYDLIVVNFANPDMVGHTGDLQAAMAACEAVDAALGQAVKALHDMGGAMIVTADHGNCETMVDPGTGGPHTAHTTNPVPVILVGGGEGTTLRNGRLADLAPTLLGLMDVDLPPEMTGESLIRG